jgi:hypothetical protein
VIHGRLVLQPHLLGASGALERMALWGVAAAMGSGSGAVVRVGARAAWPARPAGERSVGLRLGALARGPCP